MKIIAGLGNPGKKYDKTRHNAGFDCLDLLAEKKDFDISQKKFKALYGTAEIGDEKVIFVKPQTFMNLSGEAVAAFTRYFKIDVKKDLLVIYDDLDLSLGKMRIRKMGSAGGHNGIKSIISEIGTESFCRLRLGIDKPERKSMVISHVLSTFADDDRVVFEKMLEKAHPVIENWIENGYDEARNVLSRIN